MAKDVEIYNQMKEDAQELYQMMTYSFPVEHPEPCIKILGILNRLPHEWIDSAVIYLTEAAFNHSA
jgi:hypothetical protein